MIGSMIKTILWDPFPGLLKVFVAYFLVFLICALFWKMILVLRLKTGSIKPKESSSSTGSAAAAATAGNTSAAKSTSPLESILQNANEHYQKALQASESNNKQQAVMYANMTIAFIKSAMEIATPSVIAERLGGVTPTEFIQLIQQWIQNELQSNSSSTSSTSSSSYPTQNSSLTFAQLRAKGPFQSRRP